MSLISLKLNPHQSYRILSLGLIAATLLVTFLAQQVTVKKIAYRNFTDDERTVLAIVKSDPKAKIDNQDLILRIAKDTTTIAIDHCLADPVVSKFTNGQVITFQNNDPVSHTIELDHAHSYTVPAKSRKLVQANFGKDPSIWGCACDNSIYVCGLFIEMPTGPTLP